MPPTAEDVRDATLVSESIVAAGMGRVRRVVMIGSRATGVARPDSDLDLVVLVEIPLRAAAWRERELAAECKRLYQFVGSTPFRIDISVRTTDQ